MNATIRWSLALALVVFVSPDTLFSAPPHTGQVIHDGFELSDLALGLLAALAGPYRTFRDGYATALHDAGLPVLAAQLRRHLAELE